MMNPILVIKSASGHRMGVAVLFGVETYQKDIKRLNEAHRALRSLPPEMMFIGFNNAGNIKPP